MTRVNDTVGEYGQMVMRSDRGLEKSRLLGAGDGIVDS